MAGQFLGHDQADVAAAEGGDKKHPVGMEVDEAVGVFVINPGRFAVAFHHLGSGPKATAGRAERKDGLARLRFGPIKILTKPLDHRRVQQDFVRLFVFRISTLDPNHRRQSIESKILAGKTDKLLSPQAGQCRDKVERRTSWSIDALNLLGTAVRRLKKLVEFFVANSPPLATNIPGRLWT